MFSALTLFGALSLAAGSLGYFVLPACLSFGVTNLVNLAENGLVYKLYMNPPFETQSRYLLFEITNPHQVLRGAKMRFRVKGPYYYRTLIKRDKILFSDSNERVKFDSHRKLYLDESRSANLDENIWLLNPILPGALKTIKSTLLDRLPFQRLVEPILFNGANLLLDQFKERLIVRTTPRVFLEGRKVELLELLAKLAGRFGLTQLLPPGPPQNVFGLAYVQNETVDRMEIFTGLGRTRHKFAEISRWKDKTKNAFWPGECGQLKGTNGELYKPLLNTSQAQRVFFSPLCRSFNLIPIAHEPIETSAGMAAWEFKLSPRLFQGARSLPKNRCFCEDLRTYDCQFDGLLSMGPCFFDSPLFFARPNFEGADRLIRQTTEFDDSIRERLPEKQSFALDQLTGSLLALNLTLMAVFKVVKQPYMRDLARLQNLTYVPVFLVTESLEMPIKIGWQIYALQQLTNYYKPAMLGTAGMGAATLAMRFISFARQY